MPMDLASKITMAGWGGRRCRSCGSGGTDLGNAEAGV